MEMLMNSEQTIFARDGRELVGTFNHLHKVGIIAQFDIKMRMNASQTATALA
jgi:hypothetical protein